MVNKIAGILDIMNSYFAQLVIQISSFHKYLLVSKWFC